MSADLEHNPSAKENRVRYSTGSAGAAVAIASPVPAFDAAQEYSHSGLALGSFQYLVVKRGFDIAFAATALVLLSPIYLVIALLVKATSRGPIFFCQERVGQHGRLFSMLKFRTMEVRPLTETDTVWTVPINDRITRVGRFLRRTSLDELPQFINVLFGDMSVVGPRPERPYFVSQFEKIVEGYNARHDGVVGITGWAQVNGLRGDTCIHTRIAHDIHYLRNWSLLLDLKIICKTVLDVFA